MVPSFWLQYLLRLIIIYDTPSINISRGDKMKEQVKQVLDKIRPMLQADGGDVELVDVENGIVKVKLKGACSGCPMSQMTLKNGIERMIKKEIPEVKSVESAN
jgi:Fe-S cluster biogenesis protein NfuA